MVGCRARRRRHCRRDHAAGASAIALAEGLALRSILVYGVIGAALALVMAYGLDFAGYVVAPDSPFAREREVLAAAGIAGGFVYWLFAGRNAGAWK